MLPRTCEIDPDRSIDPGYHAKWARDHRPLWSGLCYVVERSQPNLMTVAGVILAAGAGSRFEHETHKLRSRIGGRTVFEIALRSLIEANLDETIVVTGATDLGDLVPSEVSVVFNSAWASGQASSLQAAVAHCRDQGHEAMVVGLGDQPGVEPATWVLLAHSDARIAVATYDGVRGNPVRLDADVWDLLPTEGDQGARPLMASHPELVTQISCSGRADDIDTTEDLRRWNC